MCRSTRLLQCSWGWVLLATPWKCGNAAGNLVQGCPADWKSCKGVPCPAFPLPPRLETGRTLKAELDACTVRFWEHELGVAVRQAVPWRQLQFAGF